MPRLGPLVALAGIALALTAGAARAQTTWTGAATANWADAGNWTNGVPAAGVTATFNGPGNGNTAVNLGGATRAVGSILFDTASAAAYTFSGNAGDALSFDSGGGITIN